MSTRAQHLCLAMITIMVLACTLLFAHANNTPNCNDPHTWSTRTGVAACAVEEGN